MKLVLFLEHIAIPSYDVKDDPGKPIGHIPLPSAIALLEYPFDSHPCPLLITESEWGGDVFCAFLMCNNLDGWGSERDGLAQDREGRRVRERVDLLEGECDDTGCLVAVPVSEKHGGKIGKKRIFCRRDDEDGWRLGLSRSQGARRRRRMDQSDVRSKAGGRGHGAVDVGKR